MILFLIFLALVSGALIVKIPLLGLFFMVIITYIVFIQRISYIVYALILISVIISSTYFYSDRDTFKKETIDYFTISDYKYNSDTISYIGEYENYRFYVYMENEVLLPIGTVCNGDFEVVKPTIERNFIKRNQALSMKISNVVGSIYVKDDRLNCSETKKTVKMKINTLKYKYTEKVLKSSNYPYTGDILMLSIGNKMMLDSQFFSALQKLGIYHLYVISGTHVAYITMVLIFLFTRFRLPIEYVKALVVICLLIFLMVNIFSPSVLRAVLMAVLLIITSY
ncbi:ComEC/Rec2 family competence protein, partial [Nosocomiicoccus massiliensis]|uniref:ComEC/Rec2 family competence protein n=1 Tax=Nosocomiicoccus massiliensis TaxID=1232430 RepID=UPI000595129A